MKAQLIFDLNDPDDRESYAQANKAQDFACALREIHEELRKMDKYESMSQDAKNLFIKIENKIESIMDDNNIHLNEI